MVPDVSRGARFASERRDELRAIRRVPDLLAFDALADLEVRARGSRPASEERRSDANLAVVLPPEELGADAFEPVFFKAVFFTFFFNPIFSEDAMSKGMVMKSRYTPGLQTAEDVSLSVDDRVVYKLEDGSTVGGVITSVYMQHENGCYGWEARFADDGQIGFMDERRIIGWPGKAP